ncbi:MAG: Ig-like domain-containing protein, partial [Clostridia bacterium]|nr:Ig-like domain-containing protein [Clostridia bacterium]
MGTLKPKKALSLVLAVIILFTMIPNVIFTSATSDDLPVMEVYNSASSGDYHKYYNSVYSVTFLDRIDYNDIASADTLYSWDVSANKDASVMAWMKKNTDASEAAGSDRYDVYIGGEGGVSANADSSYIFYCFYALKEINGLDNFKTHNVTTFFRMFEKCRSLEYLDLSSFDTSNVTNFNYMFSECQVISEINLCGWNTEKATAMAYMFNNCHALTYLDLSSFNTENVTNMKRMFYKCMELDPVYIGQSWSVENVTDDGEMFNCCYAIVGGKEVYDREHPYSPTKEYAKTKEEGGFLTYKAPEEYEVTYEFIGEVIPEGVSVPDKAIYTEGTKVDVSDAPSADGYVFSGWTTSDTTVADNSFTVNNDVHFVGSWSKLYKVEYRYADGYEVPYGAPELPEAEYYTAGEYIDLFGVPYVYRHLFFGWTTEDADVAGDMFIMPENDVVFYGYFKIPVESVEFMTEEDTVTINKDETTKINVYVNPEDATIKDIIFESSDEKVVKVDKYGNITAVGEGEATVTVKSADDPTKSDTVNITVKIPVTEIITDKTEITLNKGDEGKITAEVNPEATNQRINYESNDETVVKVDEKGNITAVGEGTATVTVSSDDDPTVKKEITVTVKIPVTEITVKDKEITLDINEIQNAGAQVNEDATNKELIYESSDPGVIKVDSNGDIIAVGKGTATVTVTSKDDSSIKETVTVTVKKPSEDIIIPEENKDIILEIGDEKEIGAAVKPEDSDYGLTYESDNPDIAEVTEDGKIIAKKEGEVTVTVKTEDGKAEETVKVTVKKPYVPTEDIIAEKDTFELEEGETDKITVTVTPDGATNKEVSYESSDESIVKVDENGNITAVGEGTATVTVTSKDNSSVKETVTVTVKKPYVPTEDIIAEKDTFELEEGETDKITVTITPDGA